MNKIKEELRISGKGIKPDSRFLMLYKILLLLILKYTNCLMCKKKKSLKVFVFCASEQQQKKIGISRNCQLKKNAQPKSCKFYLGTLPRTIAQETVSQIALRICSVEIREESTYIGVFAGEKKKGHTIKGGCNGWWFNGRQHSLSTVL